MDNILRCRYMRIFYPCDYLLHALAKSHLELLLGLQSIKLVDKAFYHYGDKRGLKLRGRIIMVTVFRE